jgi:UDPglucose 6-dehydrogenase
MGLLLSSATLESNEKRLSLIAQQIVSYAPKSIGIYRLNMKAGSSNLRDSSSLRLLSELLAANIEIGIYEPLIEEDFYIGCKVFKSLEQFKDASSLIVANRITPELGGSEHKLFSRDLFGVS